jgi:serine/threonine protein kinase
MSGVPKRHQQTLPAHVQTTLPPTPYQRFVREIQFLRDHQGLPGLLPLVDAHLPDSPTKSDQPWLAMPIATPIGEALVAASLEQVVAAVSVIADTVARLQEQLNVAHRDIKPGNLYEFEGAWLIGDFGLVALPDTDTLTREGQQLGPAHFTAYEMILDPLTADPHAADIYSLGKTLWVLATGQTWPPEGHQPAGTSGFTVGDYRPHPRASLLDSEIDHMTRLAWTERPSKRQVARALEAWRVLSAQPVPFDMSDARARLRAKLASAISQTDEQARRKEQAYAAVRRLQELTAPLNDELKALYPERVQIDLQTDDATRNYLLSRNSRNVAFQWQRCSLVAPFDGPMATELKMSRALELHDDGQLHLRLMVSVAPQRTFGSDFNWMSQNRSAPVGSVEATKLLEDGIAELAETVRQAVEVLIEKLPEQ